MDTTIIKLKTIFSNRIEKKESFAKKILKAMIIGNKNKTNPVNSEIRLFIIKSIGTLTKNQYPTGQQ